jgi:hypothetical protein
MLLRYNNVNFDSGSTNVSKLKNIFACENSIDMLTCTCIMYCLTGDPNVQDTLRGCTAMHYAASQGHTECLRLLLAVESMCLVKNTDGESALDVAVGECRKLLQAERE